jgi:hypothetical protein
MSLQQIFQHWFEDVYFIRDWGVPGGEIGWLFAGHARDVHVR